MPTRLKSPSRAPKRARRSSIKGSAPSLQLAKTSNRSFGRINIYKNIGFPKQLRTTIKYNDFIVLTTAGGFNNASWSANGCYDPYLGTGGHQPLYFSKFMAIYNHYFVISSKIKLTSCPVPTSNTPVVVGVYQNDDTTVTPVSAYAAGEQTDSTTAVIGPGSSSAIKVLTATYNAVRSFGPGTLANNALRGNVSANPTEIAAYTVFTQPVDASTSSTVSFYLEIWYDVIFNEPKDVTS